MPNMFVTYLNRFLGWDPPAAPATKRQIGYARSLGITIPEGADKATLSALIGQAESPSRRRQRQDYNEQQRIRKYGQDKIDEEARWNALADADKWMLVVLSRGKSRVAEVARINGAQITTRGKIKIVVETMKVANVRYVGPLVVVGRYLEISSDKIQWHEIVDEVDIRDVRGFQNLLARSMSRAQH